MSNQEDSHLLHTNVIPERVRSPELGAAAGSTNFRLRKLETNNGITKAEYELCHSTPGRDGTFLREYLDLFIDGVGVEAAIKLAGCNGPTPDDALDRMANWLRRMAQAIENRKRETLPLS